MGLAIEQIAEEALSLPRVTLIYSSHRRKPVSSWLISLDSGFRRNDENGINQRFPSEARALLADRLVESLDPLEDGYIRQLWATEARARRDDVLKGLVKTIPGQEALDRVRKSVTR